MKRYLLPAAILAIQCAPARADFPCQAAGEVLPTVELCEENDYFVNAADSCLKRLDGEIQARTNRLSAVFQVLSTQSTSAQNAKLENSGTDLRNTDTGLRDLIAKAKAYRQQMAGYVPALVYPGHPTPQMLAANDLAAFLGQLWCYHDNRVDLLSRLAAMDRKIGDLEKTLAATDSLRGSTRDRDHSLQGTPGGAAPIHSQAGAGARVPANAGKNPADASTITGAIQDPQLP